MSRTIHPRPPRIPAERCETWEQAFNLCRERNRPVKVVVGNVCKTVYPSGRARNERQA